MKMGRAMGYRMMMIFAVLLDVAACAKKTSNDWGDIDYSKVHNRDVRENDSSYVAPTIANCVDDDLYNCR